MDQVDTVFAQRLRAKIELVLQGDANQPGLYSTTAHGIPSWDLYLRTVGEIRGLERAYALVTETVQELADAKPGTAH
jgi:hypothetical protein